MAALGPTSILRREARAALPAVASVLLLEAGYLGSMATKTAGEVAYNFFGDNKMAFGGTFWVFAVIVVMLVGVLCGAEERERGTDNFVKRFPVTPNRVLAEKVAGSALVLGIWCVGAILVLGIVGPLSQKGYFEAVLRTVTEIAGLGGSASGSSNPFTFESVVSWCLLLFFFSLAIGSWTGRVMITAGVSGMGAFLYVFACNVVFTKELGDAIRSGARIEFALAGVAIAIAATLYRYQKREGT